MVGLPPVRSAARGMGAVEDASRLARSLGLLVILVGLLARSLFGASHHVFIRHARTARTAQGQQPPNERSDHNDNDDERLHVVTRRINPSCEVLATSRPSRANILPRENPRAAEALGLSVEYRSQSSTPTLR